MSCDNDLVEVYVILGKVFIASTPYDAQGALVLLKSIAAGISDDSPNIVDVASHIHVVAALGNKITNHDARRSLIRVVNALERTLVMSASAKRARQPSP